MGIGGVRERKKDWVLVRLREVKVFFFLGFLRVFYVMGRGKVRFKVFWL